MIHQPVMPKECLEALGLRSGAIAVDATLGLGGHSSLMMQAIAPKGHLYAFDKDERNIDLAKPRLAEIGSFVTVFHDSFSSLKDRLKREGVSQVDAILFDLGLSSPHLDDPNRGFSFQKDGPLDMRFDASKGVSAADLLSGATEAALAEIFYKYGEIRSSRKLAAVIVERRKKLPITRTGELKEIVEETLGRGPVGKNLVAQVFQALRMEVNEELKALELGLNQAIELLAPHGKLVVLSYHSLEDRFVKRLFRWLATDQVDPNDPFGRRVLRTKSLSLLNKKPISASPSEIAENFRARSAKLRAVEKI